MNIKKYNFIICFKFIHSYRNNYAQIIIYVFMYKYLCNKLSLKPLIRSSCGFFFINSLYGLSFKHNCNSMNYQIIKKLIKKKKTMHRFTDIFGHASLSTVV